MIIPKKLFPGAKVGLICASGPLPEGRLAATLDAVRRDGLTPVAGKSCVSRRGYLAGGDALRASDINETFADESIDAVFCVRGGYGAQRTLDMLDYVMIRKNPKLFAGYSDATALHTVFNRFCGFVTYHAPMYSVELYKGADEYTARSYRDNLFAGGVPVFSNPAGFELKILAGGRAQGRLTGGNLSLLASSVGTPYEFDARGAILFIEEIGEEPYRIDRALLQLKRAGKFRDCSGIIFGSFKNCEAENPEKSLSLAEIFEDVALSEGKPTVCGFACGHSMPSLTLPLGARFNLDADGKKIRMLE